MRLAAPTVKRITLELGGKSPNLVFADADLVRAVPSSVWAIYYAAGQSCEARSRVLVEKPMYDYGGGGVRGEGRGREGRRPAGRGDADGLPDLGGAPHRVHGFVEQGCEEGAEVVLGGAPSEGAGAFYPPTVLAGVANDIDRCAGGDLRPGGDRDSVRGRGRRRPHRERRPLRPDGDGVDG